MAEYIEREALEWSFDAATMAFLEKEDNLFDRKSVLAGMSVAAGIVYTVPAADVVQVVHGHWVKQSTKEWDHYCSVCKGPKPYFYGYGVLDSAFCPNCGAKMGKEAT